MHSYNIHSTVCLLLVTLITGEVLLQQHAGITAKHCSAACLPGGYCGGADTQKQCYVGKGVHCLLWLVFSFLSFCRCRGSSVCNSLHFRSAGPSGSSSNHNTNMQG